MSTVCSSNDVSTDIDRSPNNGHIAFLTTLYIPFLPHFQAKKCLLEKKSNSTHGEGPSIFPHFQKRHYYTAHFAVFYIE